MTILHFGRSHRSIVLLARPQNGSLPRDMCIVPRRSKKMLTATDDSKGRARKLIFQPPFLTLGGFVESYAIKPNRRLSISPHFYCVKNNLVGFLWTLVP